MSATSVSPAGTTGGESTGGDTTGASESDSTTGEPLPASVCDPQPEEIRIVATVEDWPDVPGNEFELSCTVADIYHLADTPLTGIVFDCAEGMPTVFLPIPFELDLSVGETVQVSAFVDEPWWSNVFVAVHREGELVLAGMSADSLPADDGAPQHPAADFWAPLTVTAVEDVCDVELDPYEHCDAFICPGTCSRDRRLALQLTMGADDVTVLDRTHGTLGPLQVDVGEAVERVEVYCTDTPNGWYSFAATRVAP